MADNYRILPLSSKKLLEVSITSNGRSHVSLALYQGPLREEERGPGYMRMR